MCYFRLLFGGPVPHLFYQFLDKLVPYDSKNAIFKQLFIERLLFTPFYQYFVLYTISRLQVIFMIFATIVESEPEPRRNSEPPNLSRSELKSELRLWKWKKNKKKKLDLKGRSVLSGNRYNQIFEDPNQSWGSGKNTRFEEYIYGAGLSNFQCQSRNWSRGSGKRGGSTALSQRNLLYSFFHYFVEAWTWTVSCFLIWSSQIHE